MLRKLALLAALSSVLWLSTAAALGLGEIEVKSGLNQRFVASIPLTATSAEEAENIQVSLASVAEFQRAGLERSEYLSSLRFTIASDGGSPRIEVSSAQIAREPFVNFLVEVRARGGRLLREYTILLDPPTLPPPAAERAPAAPYAAAPQGSGFFETSEETQRRPAPPESIESPESPVAAAPEFAASEGSTYGPVQPRETFWGIASKLRPDPSLTMDQMLLAIYDANRGAFEGSINRLRAGSMLRVPSSAEIAAVSPATAKARVNALRNGGGGAKPVRPKPRPLTPLAEPPIPEASKPEIVSEAPAVPASPSVTKPAPAPKPVPKVVVPPPPPAPVPEPAPAPPPPEPAPIPEPAVTPPPPEAPVTAETPTDAVAPAMDGSLPPAMPETPPAPEAAMPAEPVPAPEPAPAPAPIEEESGLIEMLIPLFGALLVLGGLGYLVASLLKKRREKTAAAASFAPPPMMPPPLAKPVIVPVVAVVKPAPAKSADAARRELEKLEDTLSGEGTADFHTRQLQTQQISAQTQKITTQLTKPLAPESATQLPTFDSTQAFGVEDMAFARKAVETGNIDFDVTGQFAAETVQINLDANDPMAEADFHLAYGLYDEAILLLRQASGRDPERTELRVKLAETYFAAGRPLEFQDTAEGLKSKVDDATWQKLAILGQQLCPDAQIFKGSDVSAMATDLDLAFDEPAMPSMTSMPEIGAAETPQRAADSGLDFRLEELELPKLDTSSRPDMPSLKRDDALEFDLGDFDLGKAAPALSAKSAKEAGNAVEFDMEGIDLGGFDTPAATSKSGAADFKSDELRLEDFDIGDSDSISSGDETSTKLDLARAYADMGDNEMARNLLTEVLLQGNDAQKVEAQTLLGRLS